MAAYMVFDPLTGRRCPAFGSLVLGEMNVGNKDGTSFRTVQPIIRAQYGNLEGYVLDPRMVIETLGGRVVYNPRAHLSRLGGWIREWMDENPGWPRDIDKAEWEDVESPQQLTDTPALVKADRASLASGEPTRLDIDPATVVPVAEPRMWP